MGEGEHPAPKPLTGSVVPKRILLAADSATLRKVVELSFEREGS
jgi:hypothetical protein